MSGVGGTVPVMGAVTECAVDHTATPTCIAMVRVSLGARDIVSWVTTVTLTGRAGTSATYVRHEHDSMGCESAFKNTGKYHEYDE